MRSGGIIDGRQHDRTGVFYAGSMAKSGKPTFEHKDIIDYLQHQTEMLPDGPISVNDLVNLLGVRSFSIAVLLFALPMIFPMPPGVPMIAGLVICLIGVQMMTRRQELWLPDWLKSKEISRSTFLKAYAITRRYFGWMFKLVRPRYKYLTGNLARRLSGALFFFLGFVMVLPIPFGGNTPPALACTVLALSLTDRDGLVYISGLIIAGIALTVNVFIVVGLLRVFGMMG